MGRTTRNAKPEISPTQEVGTPVVLPYSNCLVRLPDGSVVTSRSDFTFRTAGEYAIIPPKGGDEIKVTVTDSKATKKAAGK